MKKSFKALPAFAALSGFLLAASPGVAEDGKWPNAWFEIFKLAPGKQEAFLRNIALSDEVRKAGGQQPLRLFIHEDGADWDVLIYKQEGDTNPTPEQKAAMDAKRKELGLPSGPAYFVAIRENIAAHTDTKTVGPVSAAEWLAKLDEWRAAHPPVPAKSTKR
ncbi:MAG: hypothetical protein JNK21_16660 [Rhodospirillaceae bacterium]|nr:hypothetical protein [Rhodospirillaceae bacterium]